MEHDHSYANTAGTRWYGIRASKKAWSPARRWNESNSSCFVYKKNTYAFPSLKFTVLYKIRIVCGTRLIFECQKLNNGWTYSFLKFDPGAPWSYFTISPVKLYFGKWHRPLELLLASSSLYIILVGLVEGFIVKNSSAWSWEAQKSFIAYHVDTIYYENFIHFVKFFTNY